MIEYGNFESYVAPGYVKIYGVEWCEFCQKTKDSLDKLGVSYTFLDVEKDIVSKQHFKEIGGSAYPLILTSNFLIKGYNENVINENFPKEN